MVYIWKIMPMGLKNAPAIFQRVMEHVLRDLPFADAYIDDVILGNDGDTLDDAISQHKKDLLQVLETFYAANIVFSTKQIQLFLKEVKFCCHILSDQCKQLQREGP